MATQSTRTAETKNMIDSGSPLIFISHDTRDAKIAEAFSELLSSVSTGVIESFRSSDKKGTQGIEYGMDWYPKIMEKLAIAKAVVCLLTNNSVGRPWILYEAGVAKGNLDIKVIGIAIGIPLAKATVGPFAQFQNCLGDAEDELLKLVVELITKCMPSAKPKEDILKPLIKGFVEKTKELLTNPTNNSGKSENQEITATQIFEEMKRMFDRLPDRMGYSERKFRYPERFPDFTMMLDMLCHEVKDIKLAIKMLLSVYTDEFPWLYEACVELVDIPNSLERRKKIDDIRRMCSILRREFDDPRTYEFFKWLERSEFWEVLDMSIERISYGEKTRRIKSQKTEDIF